ncbi:MAG: coiled-coil domain-containing protein [Christensenellales bacterium]|jgi:peptidoglycan hydrolase CwlO-like protein
MYKRLIAVILSMLFFVSAGCSEQASSTSDDRYAQLKADFDDLTAEHDTIIEERNNLQARNAELEAEADRLHSELNTTKAEVDRLQSELNTIKTEYVKLKEEAGPFLQLTAAEQAAEVARAEKARIEAEEEARAAQEEAQRREAERAAEEEAKRKAEEAARRAEEAKGYETGITFKELSRSPEKNAGKKVKFTGYVLQVLEGSSMNNARMSTKGKYDDVIYLMYEPKLLNVRLLEDDKITVYGTFVSMYTYQSVLGSSVTLPLVSVDRIDILD